MLKIILFIISAILIVITVSQSENASGLSKAITGGDSLKLFANKKERGTDKAIVIVTAVLIGLYFLFSYLGGRF